MSQEINHNQHPALPQPLRQPPRRQHRILKMMPPHRHSRDIEIPELGCLEGFWTGGGGVDEISDDGVHFGRCETLGVGEVVEFLDHGGGDVDSEGGGYGR